MNKNGEFLSSLDGFAAVDARAVKSIIAAGSDIALLITAEGVVQEVYIGPDAPPANDFRSWSGHGIYDIVTEEIAPQDNRHAPARPQRRDTALA